MKKLIYLIMPSIMLLACGGENEDLNKELEELRKQNVELKEQANQLLEKDSLINEYAKFISDIQTNLSLIAQKENALVLKSKNPELSKNDSSIVNDLKALGTLLADNKTKINSMKSKLNKANVQIKDLETVILKLTAEAETKDQQIRALEGELSNLGVAFDELLVAYEENIVVLAEKNETIQDQQDEINTAYFAVGTFKELNDNGVIYKEGGFIGLGKSKKLKEDFNKDYFTKINITEKNEIALGSSKVYIVTTHPQDSYEIVNNGEKLKIKDAKKFWGASKYLVVEIK